MLLQHYQVLPMNNTAAARWHFSVGERDSKYKALASDAVVRPTLGGGGGVSKDVVWHCSTAVVSKVSAWMMSVDARIMTYIS